MNSAAMTAANDRGTRRKPVNKLMNRPMVEPTEEHEGKQFLAGALAGKAVPCRNFVEHHHA